jgi:hypothetical protein
MKPPFIMGFLHNELDAVIPNLPFHAFVIDENDLLYVSDKE